MKKRVIGVLILIILIGIIFFTIDNQRAINGESPMFCIQYSTQKDGGTKEYIGLGYKVIEYHKLNGYKKIQVGNIFLKYDSTLGGTMEVIPIEK